MAMVVIFGILISLLVFMEPGQIALGAGMEHKPFWFQVPDKTSDFSKERNQLLDEKITNKIIPLTPDKETNPSSNLCLGFCERRPGVSWSIEWK